MRVPMIGKSLGLCVRRQHVPIENIAKLQTQSQSLYFLDIYLSLAIFEKALEGRNKVGFGNFGSDGLLQFRKLIGDHIPNPKDTPRKLSTVSFFYPEILI